MIFANLQFIIRCKGILSPGVLVTLLLRTCDCSAFYWVWWLGSHAHLTSWCGKVMWFFGLIYIHPHLQHNIVATYG